MSIYIYDSVQKKKVKFESIIDSEVSIYICGPTVYDNAHLGHARSAISFDLLKRVLKANTLNVTLAKNFTDIDDKIIKKMQESGKTLKEITEYYIDRYIQDMTAVGVEQADIEPKATDSIDAIESMVKKLLDNNFAYILENGDIYFDTSKDKKYGTISSMVTDDTENISRIDSVKGKKNPKDFALWKACDNKDICFKTKIGEGRPGWHIECSAMIDKHFTGTSDYCIDIHCGGADLLFPHHENEATQSRCALNKEVAKYWMHNGFVNIDGEKMSKSLGNSFFLKDALKEYDGDLIRFYLISVHYRNDFNFNEEDLLSSKKRLDKLYRLKKRLYGLKISKPNSDFKKKLIEALNDDLNSSKALAVIDEMVAYANEKLDNEPKNKALKQELLGNILYINDILAIGSKDAIEWFQQGVSLEDKLHIQELIELRANAKKDKDYEKSDKIRDELKSMGVELMDTPSGTKWEKM